MVGMQFGDPLLIGGSTPHFSLDSSGSNTGTPPSVSPMIWKTGLGLVQQLLVDILENCIDMEKKDVLGSEVGSSTP